MSCGVHLDNLHGLPGRQHDEERALYVKTPYILGDRNALIVVAHAAQGQINAGHMCRLSLLFAVLADECWICTSLAPAQLYR